MVTLHVVHQLQAPTRGTTEVILSEEKRDDLKFLQSRGRKIGTHYSRVH